jgi:hypothetical protein
LARRTDAVIDSLVQTGMSRQGLERLRARIASGEIGFFGGGGQPQQRGVFSERPGEGALPRQQIAAEGGRAQRQPATPRELATPRDTALAARAPAGGGGEAAGDVETIDPSFTQDFVRLLRPPGQGGGGGAFGGQRLAPLVATGDYLVTLEVGGQRQRQVLRVERIGGNQSGAIAATPSLDRDR